MSGDEPNATLFSFHAARSRRPRATRSVREVPATVPIPIPIPTTANLFAALEEPVADPVPALPGHLPETVLDPAAAPSLSPASLPVARTAPRHLYRVRELIAELRQHVEGAYTAILHVEGELSNVRPAASGHLYFTLKDGDAQLPVVLFRRNALGLSFRPADGMAVEVHGRISLYETRGQLQLIAESVRPRGLGALQLAFEQLRDRLRAEGLFDRERKPLPAFPHCIGIVTSPTGAAIHDIIQVVRRRHARLNLLIYPAVVQGSQCAASVAAGIRWFNRHPDRVDLILLARGGGSLEDLAGFNDEALARAIVASALPVVSAIGHEVDSTIADFVADLRAPTPSAAAELITAAQHRIEERVAALERRVERAGAFHLMRARQRFSRLSAAQMLVRLETAVARRQQRIDELRFRLETASERRLRPLRTHLRAVELRLRLASAGERRLAPVRRRLAALDQRLAGYDPARRVAGQRVRHTQASARLLRYAHLLGSTHRHRLERLHDRLEHRLEQAFALTAGRLAELEERLRRAPDRLLSAPRARLERAEGRLAALSPLAVLSRGYAIVYAPDGSILRAATQAAPGMEIRARLGQGGLRAVVLEQNLSETVTS